ncbi:hypothetical protein ABW19_dt0204899 [Dactylella cylindrospora]|nr:hypothetical protein ABW19_dt0204899 [Dactylella cylindrospora]
MYHSGICHGPAAFVNVRLSNGEHLVQGQAIGGFSDVEEEAVGLTDVVPFSIEQEFKKNGGLYEKTDPWGAKVTVGRGGKLITGTFTTFWIFT